MFRLHAMKCNLCEAPLDLISMTNNHDLPKHLFAIKSLIEGRLININK